MHPQEFLALVHHADEAAEAGVFGLEQGVEFAQGRALSASSYPAFKGGSIRRAEEFANFNRFANDRVNDAFAEVELFFDAFAVALLIGLALDMEEIHHRIFAEQIPEFLTVNIGLALLRSAVRGIGFYL